MRLVCTDQSSFSFCVSFQVQGATSAVRARLNALEEKHKDMEGKLTQMLLSQAQSNCSLDDVKSMLKKCMERFSSDSGFSPSIGVSAIETPAQLGSTKLQVVGSIQPPNDFKMPATVDSVHVDEGSGDSDTPKAAPSALQAKDRTPSSVEDHVDDVLMPLDVNHDADVVSSQTPIVVSALIHLGGPLEEAGLLSKKTAAEKEQDQALVVNSHEKPEEEVIGKVDAKEREEVNAGKTIEASDLPQESKFAPRARKLKKLNETSEEGSPSTKKHVSLTEVVELSPDGSAGVISTCLRASPRKHPVQVNSFVEASAAGEEDSAKVGQ